MPIRPPQTSPSTSRDAGITQVVDFRAIGKRLPDPRRLEYAKGDVILKEGSKATACYIILRGRVQISKKRPGSREPYALATVKAGEFIGEMAMLSDLPRSGTATALTGVQLLEIKRAGFLKLLREQDPVASQLALHFASTLAARCSSLLDLVVRAQDDSAEDKPKSKAPMDPREVLNKVYSLWAI